MMDWKKISDDFNEEVNDAAKYHAMAKEASGCDRQVLMDMAWDEYSHAKHLHRIMHEHGVATEGQRDVLTHTRETLESDRWW